MIRFDSKKLKYKKPFGAVKEGTAIEINVYADRRLGLYRLSLLLFRDGNWSAEVIPLKFKALKGNDDIYSAVFSVEDAGLYWYRFSFIYEGSSVFVGKGQNGSPEIGCMDSWQLTVYEKGFSAPDWVKGGIMYQIFPDRFYRSDRYSPVIRKDSHLHKCWDEPPEYIRYEDGSVPNNDFFGGNLEGVIEKLPYLEGLGVTCIYFNPIFEAASNHKYDTGDYEKIDGVFGDQETFSKLCREALKRGIHVILDGVFSHTGADSKYFNKNGSYDTQGAFQSQESPYYSWYSFDKWPDVYKGWWGVRILPEVREEETSYLEYIAGEGGILEKWLDAGADGYRLDVADELPDVFLDKLRERVKKVKPQAFIIGEVWEDASNKVSYGQRRRYLTGKQLDSVMNYVFKDAIIDYIKGGSGRALADLVESVLENYPAEAVNCLMNVLGTHDTRRILTELGSKNNLKLAAVIQYFLPGFPCIFYGDEAGMEGEGDPFCRGTYPWGNEDEDLIDFYSRLGCIREKNRDILKDGKYFTNYSDEDIIYYIRNKNQRALHVIVNRGTDERKLDLSELGAELPMEHEVVDLINGQRINVSRPFAVCGGGSMVFRVKEVY